MATNDRCNERRSFWSLMVTQFQGAFSDNVHKMLITFLILGLALPKPKEDWLVLWTGVLFALPFILFSMAGGWLANRYSKRSVTIGVKILEIAVMALAMIGLAMTHVQLLLVCVFLMSLQSALFGPSKYGLLPEILPEKRLSWGNGVIAMGTNVAILLGTVTAGFLADIFAGRQIWSGVILVMLAGLGTLTSLTIGRLPAADPSARFQWNFLGDLMHQLHYIRRDRVMWLSLLGNVYFSFLGSLLLINVTMYGAEMLHLTFRQNSLLQTAVAVGIGAGALAAGYLSGRKIEYGLVPFGSIGITVFCALLARRGLSQASLLWQLTALGFFGGFFIVPISAILQHRPEPSRKGGVLGANNLLSFAGVMIGFVVNFALRKLGLMPPDIFLAGALMTLAGTAYVVWILPESLLRLMLWLLTNTIYRIRVEGRDNIPEKGGALFVCNHVSFVDALLLIASTDRMIRGIVFKDIYEHPLVKPFARIMRAIPISAQQRPREMLRSLRAASDAIRDGEVVVIFAEGQITRIGQLLPFRRGMQYIMRDVDAPIIPVNLDGVWGSVFSFERGRFFGKLPHRIPYPVTVSFGKPMPATASPFEVRQAVQQLQSDAWPHRKCLMQPLQRALIHIGRRHPFRFAMADQRIPKMTYGAALMRSVFLARRLRPLIAGEEMIGVLLPPSVGGALANYALMLMARVPVNLNYTASSEIIASCARQCGLKTVITSRAFLEKVKVTVPVHVIYIEDLVQSPRWTEKWMASWMSFLLPARMLERNIGRERRLQLDDLATVIFSSGSTGEPKGVMLTHYNIGSNIEQAGQMFAFKASDRILGVLPFFHSFGFTVTLVLPPVLGTGVVYHPNPLDAGGIGELVQKYGVTFLLSTPTFLQMYIRSIEPEQFGSLQYVVTGAEKLPERVAVAFEDRFGIRPLEGYGCTECAPVVAVNTRDFRAAGFRQVGAKRGKIGHPVPGVSVKIVDPETFAPLPLGEAGMLLVKGPNIMKGYLHQPDKMAEAIRDGWYVTGDIAALDEEGFIQITDRAARFSKIGGEMVPHIRVEEKLHELAGATEHTFSVAGVPDEKKGERLVVLHLLPEDRLQPVLEKLAGCDLPNLWKPRPDCFHRIEKFPHLGTGKLDLRKIRDIAAEVAG